MKSRTCIVCIAVAVMMALSLCASARAQELPKATVTTSSDLASQITGSLASASSLASSLGKWLAIAVLIAAFLLASLLTMSAVTRRIREFGTLKALGWKSRRIVFQVMGESIAVGIVGGAVGVGLGFLGAALVDKFSSPLTASLASNVTGSATPGGSPWPGCPSASCWRRPARPARTGRARLARASSW